ncbi:MAG: hypothetical protein LRY66_16410 [Saccharospirillaceae bacterium]|nr:hypothetical protein [Saccharospirillaceae bacterium]MCD8532889.1 hypothetical protein [Saccharospirillaceae bacterium]
MELQPKRHAETPQGQARNLTAYFDLLHGINQQFGAAMALNRQAKINAAPIRSARISPQAKSQRTTSKAPVSPVLLSAQALCTDEAA